MSVCQKIRNLKSTWIPNTEILDVTYENTGLYLPGDNIQLTELPEFYRIYFVSRPGKQSEIYTEVWLPNRWNGIFLGLGNGGMAGNIHYLAMAEYIKKGYAVANTDMGTSRGRASGVDNPDVWKDFGWRATHLMTTAGKELVYRHYGKRQAYSYFVGGSTGGQQALAEAQRFPEDYDGIIAGVPANNRTFLHTYFLWNHLHLRSKQGRPLFSLDEIQAIYCCAVTFFQQRGDGIPGDQFITFPRADESIVSELITRLAAEYPGLSVEQLQALKAVYNGPVNPLTGERIYNGMPIGSEIYGCGIEECQQEESPHFYPFVWAFGEGYDGREFDFDRDLDALNKLLANDLNANEPDLTAFKQHGGKLIMYSGSADPCVPFPDAMNYYSRVLDTMGGYDKVASFFRYFLFPGKEHGANGMGTNQIWANEQGAGELDALRLWKEQGKAPDVLLAVGYHHASPEEGVAFMRPVRPFSLRSETGEPRKECPPACSEYYLNQRF